VRLVGLANLAVVSELMVAWRVFVGAGFEVGI